MSLSDIKGLDEMLLYNNQFVQDKKYEEYTSAKKTSKKLILYHVWIQG